MKVFIFFQVVSFFLMIRQPAEPNIQDVRRLFVEGAKNRKSADAFLKLLHPVNDRSQAVLVCYKGIAIMMTAKYAINPYTKFQRFKDGKLLIDHAVKCNSESTEVRFLRLSAQTNSPSFLGYNKNIREDKEFLRTGFHLVTDESLKR